MRDRVSDAALGGAVGFVGLDVVDDPETLVRWAVAGAAYAVARWLIEMIQAARRRRGKKLG